MIVVYIHGANATGTSFNFIRQNVDVEGVTLEYNSAAGFKQNLAGMVDHLSAFDDDVFFVAHSLGGVYALHLAKILGDRVRGAVTLSTPYGGSEFAALAPIFLPNYNKQLMRDIRPRSEHILYCLVIRPQCGWTQVVTTSGNSSLMMSANDGVVTLDSMRRLSGAMQCIDVPANHYEIVMHPEALRVILEAISNVEFA